MTVARGGQVSRHAGPDPDTWVDLLVDEGFDWLIVVPLGAAEPPSDVRFDLHDGVVPGGGLRLTQRDRLPGEVARSAAAEPAVEWMPPGEPPTAPAPVPAPIPATRQWRGVRLGAAVACPRTGCARPSADRHDLAR